MKKIIIKLIIGFLLFFGLTNLSYATTYTSNNGVYSIDVKSDLIDFSKNGTVLYSVDISEFDEIVDISFGNRDYDDYTGFSIKTLTKVNYFYNNQSYLNQNGTNNSKTAILFNQDYLLWYGNGIGFCVDGGNKVYNNYAYDLVDRTCTDSKVTVTSLPFNKNIIFTFKGDKVNNDEYQELIIDTGWQPIETSSGCYQHNIAKTEYKNFFPFTNYTRTGTDREAIYTNSDNGEKAIFSFYGYDIISGFTGSVIDTEDDEVITFDTDTILYSDVVFRLNAKHGIGGFTLYGDFSDIYGYNLKFPDENFYLDEEGNKKQFESGENIKLKKNYDFIDIVVPSTFVDRNIDKIEFGYYHYFTETREECFQQTEITQSIFSGATDTFDFSNTFNVSDCGGFNVIRPSCWFALSGNFIVEKVQNEKVKTYIYSVGNILNFSIPIDYKLSVSLPDGKGGGLGTFEKIDLDLSGVKKPTSQLEYINDDNKRQVLLDGQVLYTVSQGLWSKFLDKFIPTIFIVVYMFIITLLIGVIFIPVILFNHILVKLVDFLVPDIKDVKYINKNLIAFIVFMSITTILYGVFGYIMSEYMPFFPDISLAIRGFIGTFMIFILDLFQFDSSFFISMVSYINDLMITLIFLVILYRTLSSFGRLN